MVNTPNYESADPGSSPGPDNRRTTNPPLHPPFRLSGGSLKTVNCINLDIHTWPVSRGNESLPNISLRGNPGENELRNHVQLLRMHSPVLYSKLVKCLLEVSRNTPISLFMVEVRILPVQSIFKNKRFVSLRLNVIIKTMTNHFTMCSILNEANTPVSVDKWVNV